MSRSLVSGRTRYVLGALVAVLLCVLGWSFLQRAPALEPRANGRPRPRFEGPTPVPPPILTVPPAEMRDVVEADSLLKPDRRLLLAFEEVAARADGKDVTASVAALRRRWTVNVGSSPAATLSAVPEFVETLDALRIVASGARRARAGRPLAPAEAARLRSLASDPFGDGPVQALERIDRLWTSGTDEVALLDLASTAYGTLEMQLTDTLEMADLIPGRALAILAMAEAASQKRFPEREATLAYFMGYTREARLIAAGLPAGSFQRLFLEEDDAALEALAGQGAASPECRYLHLLRKASRGTLAEVESSLAKVHPNGLDHSSVLAIRLQTRSRPFGSDVETNGLLLRSVLHEAGDPEPIERTGLLALFERAQASRPRRSGTFLDSAAVEARQRAIFYSALDGLGHFYLDRLSSGPAATEFAASLEGGDPGPGAEFQRWFGNLSAFKNGTLPVSALAADLTTLPSLGQAAIRRTGRTVNDALPTDTPDRPAVARALVSSLDSRPANGELFGTICLQTLLDPLGARDYYRAFPRSSRTGHGPWLAHSSGDVAGLHAVAADTGADPWMRAQSLDYLVQRGALQGDELRAMALDVLGRADESGSDTTALRLLYDQGYLAEAESYLRRWLASHPDAEPLAKAFYASRLSHVLFLAGRFPEAWAAVEPHLSTGKEDVFWAGAEALEGLGRHAEALKMARAQIERYPDSSESRVDLAGILWRQEEYEEAAKTLADPRRPLSAEVAREVLPRRFYSAFAQAKPRARRKAIEAMVRARLNDWYLFDLALPFASAKRFDVAVEVLEAILEPHDATLDPLLRAYRYRKLDKGEEYAVDWFRRKVLSGPNTSWVAYSAFDNREFELLWLVSDNDGHWLLRAEAAALQGGVSGERRDRLLAHFRDPKTPAPYALYGLFLMGEASEEKLLEAATTSDRRCEVALMMGIRAAGEKRLADSSAWLRASLKTGQSGNSAYKRAAGLLKRWDTQRFGVPGGADIP